MRRLLSVNKASTSMHVALLVARIGIAILMLTHGIPKLITLFSGAPIQFPSVMGLSAKVSLGLAVFAEVICSVFLVVGLATRAASIPLIITMLVAVFSIHASDPFARQEPALQYLLVYLVLLFAGSGKYSVDYLLSRKGSVNKFGNSTVKDPAILRYQ